MKAKYSPIKIGIILSFLLIIIYGSVKTYNWYTGKITDRDLPVLELSGTPYDRGFKHGQLLRSEISEVYSRWKDNIAGMTGESADKVLLEFLEYARFDSIIQTYSPELIDEIKGLSAGSGQKYADVYAFQLVDEFWVYLDKKYNESKHHCSAIGVASVNGGPAYLAQNMDLENYMNGFQILIHIPESNTEPEQYILSCAGLIALNGMNAEGIGVCVNTLMELRSSEQGMPIAFMIRNLLRKKTGMEALEFLKTVNHASGQNYIIGIADSVYDFEASANQVVRFLPDTTNTTMVYHTNHALVNDDVKPWYSDYHKNVIAGITADQNSEVRFATLKDNLGGKNRQVTERKIKDILRSKADRKNPVCRSFTQRSGFFTFSSVVFTLTGKRSLQLTYGSPDRSEYKAYFFK